MSVSPSTIGAYRIFELLGRGGMGAVYRAEHLGTGQLVALKTVRLPRAGQLQSIRREIHALAGLRHPGIVRILDEGLHEGLPWYAMELLEGVSLRRWHQRLAGVAEATSPDHTAPITPTTLKVEFRRTSGLSAGFAERASLGGAEAGPRDLSTGTTDPRAGARPWDELRAVLAVVRRLCSPLAFLHGEGIVHRDLKPENVLITELRNERSFWPVLVDFGLAAQFGGELSREALTIEAGAAGTLPYMAPEQIRGELLDARADLYALGCILFELLTGRRPFVGQDRFELLERHLSSEPPAPSSLEPGLPPALDALVLRLLAKQPRDRLGHADDVAAALAELMESGDRPKAIGEPGAGYALEAPSSSIGGYSSPRLPRPRAYLYRPGFAGREQPLDLLRAQLDGLAQGKSGLVLVGGESGMGKTRLMVELGREAVRRDLRVLAGECLEVGGGFLQVFRKPLQALCDLCQEGGVEEAERMFGGRGPVLSQYEPAIGHLPGQSAHTAPADLPAKDALLRLYHCLGETLSAAAARSGELLLMLDDLQWADELSLGFLESWLRTMHNGATQAAPLRIVGTYRTEEAGALTLRQLLEAPEVESIVLGRLDEQAVGAMVSDMLALPQPPALFSRFLSRHSEGSPFFVAEYLRAAVAEGLLWRDEQGVWQVESQDIAPQPGRAVRYEDLPLPRSLRALVGRRLEGLALPARQLAEAAAVLGREADVTVLRHMTRLEDASLFSATGELMRRQVMEESGDGRLRFVHDKIREVAYERIPGAGRPAVHRAAAEAIVRSCESQPVLGEHLPELGRHWEAAGESREASACYLPAARAAADRFAHEEAERLYRAYLRLVEQPSAESIAARNELGENVLDRRGRGDEALVEHDIALRDARRMEARELEGESLRGLGHLHLHAGRVDQARQAYEEALDIFRQAGDRQSEGSALGNLAGLHMEQGRIAQALQLYEQAQDIHEQVGDRRSEGVVLGNLGLLHMGQGRMDQAQQLFEQALAVHREVGNRRYEGLALGNLAILHQERGEMAEAGQLYLQALAIDREVGDRRLEGIVLGNLALLHQEQGQMEPASRFFEQAMAVHREVGNRRSEGIVLGNLALLHQERGRMEQALQLTERALAVHREVNNRRFEGILLGNLARLELLRTADWRRAERLAEEGERLLVAVGDQVELGHVLCYKGHIALAADRGGREPLEQAESVASIAGAADLSPLGRAVSRLRRAVAAFEAGQHDRLLRGHLVEDLSEGVRQWLERNV